MADSEVLVGPKWGPGLIGTTVGLALYGVSIFQYLFYISTFPSDKRLLRCTVLFVFLLDTINTIGLLSFYYRTLISCRWQTTYTCTLEMPWCVSVVTIFSMLHADLLRDLSSLSPAFWSGSPYNGLKHFLHFFPCSQCPPNSFYAHRVWIIGGRNMLLTGAVLAAALVQLIFGFALLEAACLTGNIATLFSSQYAPINALGSAICDVIITTSVFFYFRRSQARLLWKANYMRKLNLVFVQMGLITSSSAVTLAILYFQDQATAQYLTAAPGFMLSKAYSNSMLAVLNARKLIYDQQQALSLELPTLIKYSLMSQPVLYTLSIRALADVKTTQ
ncbi:hypothetical protein F5141DRAFT_1201528, partial [Pisolithus sp. B1]